MTISGILHHFTGYLDPKVRFICLGGDLEQAHDTEQQMPRLLGASTFGLERAGK
jgi:hypothetical protein